MDRAVPTRMIGAVRPAEGRQHIVTATRDELPSLELFPKAVDGRASSSGFPFSIDEHDAVDQVL